MKKRILMLAMAVMMAITCLVGTALAVPDVDKQPDTSVGLDVTFRPVYGHDTSSRFCANDIGVLSAMITNKTDEPITGVLSIHDPALKYLDVIAKPVFEQAAGSDGFVLTVEPHASETIAYVVEFPSEPDPDMPIEWQTTATFEFETGGIMSVSSPCGYGLPELMLDTAKLKSEHKILISNVGDGGAGKIRFRFSAKAGQTEIPDGIKKLDDGRLELDFDVLMPGGQSCKHLGSDIMDLSQPWEIIIYDNVLERDVKAAEGKISK